MWPKRTANENALGQEFPLAELSEFTANIGGQQRAAFLGSRAPFIDLEPALKYRTVIALTQTIQP